MDEFKAISFSTLDDVLACYTLVKHVIYTFNGDAEKFYPEFYKVFNDAETHFTGLSRHSRLLVGFELANHVLAHLTGSKFQDDVVSFKHQETVFSERINLSSHISVAMLLAHCIDVLDSQRIRCLS